MGKNRVGVDFLFGSFVIPTNGKRRSMEMEKNFIKRRRTREGPGEEGVFFSFECIAHNRRSEGGGRGETGENNGGEGKRKKEGGKAVTSARGGNLVSSNGGRGKGTSLGKKEIKNREGEIGSRTAYVKDNSWHCREKGEKEMVSEKKKR